MAEPEVRIVGRYELHAELASGGMASVYLGRLMGAAGFAKLVAIKRLHSHMSEDPEFVQSLLQEARLAERVRHPNVVATIDVVAEEKELLLVMEYVHGESLARLLRASHEADQPCPPEIAARIICDTLLGLHAAHNSTDANGAPLCIVHRDVSPQNVMVGADGVTRLVDFGVAKALGSIGHTREGHLKGKIAYMAPELLRYEAPSPQSDVWAAAVVLWETRCARRLFRGDSEVQIWGQVLEAEIPDPAAVAGNPTALDDVILKGLSRDVTERYPTALAMAEDIQRAIRLASPAEVAAWVSTRAGPALAERAELLRRVEAAPVGASAAEQESRRPRAGWLVLAGVAFGAAAFVSWQLLGPARNVAPQASVAPPATSPPVPSPTPALPSAVATEPDASSVVEDPVAIATSATPPRPTKTASAGSKRPPPVRTEDASAPTKTPPAPDCDPPYSVDATGHKRFKLECVGGTGK